MLPAPTLPSRITPCASPPRIRSTRCSLERRPRAQYVVRESQAIEETYFLGLRMNRGVELLAIKEEFGMAAVDDYREEIAGLVQRELLMLEDGWLRLTPRGRLLSNEVFEEFLRD